MAVYGRKILLLIDLDPRLERGGKPSNLSNRWSLLVKLSSPCRAGGSPTHILYIILSKNTIPGNILLGDIGLSF